MKRSEMLNEIYRVLMVVVSPSTAQAMAKETLRMIEEKGMLPPDNNGTQTWEPETSKK